MSGLSGGKHLAAAAGGSGNCLEQGAAAAGLTVVGNPTFKVFNNMNSKIRIILSGAACIVAGSLACLAPSTANAQTPGPAADSQMMGPAPSSAYVWMAGHWNSEGGQWKWLAGHWDLPPTRSAVWISGHWIQGGSGWVWMNGAWNVAEAPQSPAMPPQPPGEPSAAAGQNGYQAPGQGMPMPSTAAPNVAGQYATGGQVPALYQPPTETYYPPIDYSSADPGYYWNGDGWAWGIYPAFALGLGWWGPGFGGWGRGFYGRGFGGGFHRAGFAGHAGASHFGGGHSR